MVRWTAAQWMRTAVLGYAVDLAGIVVAAVVSSRVSVTVAGALAAAAVATVFELLILVLLFVATRPPDTLWAMIPAALFILTAPVLSYGGLLVALQVVPGFDVNGVWGYALLLATTFAASEGFSRLAGRVVPVTPKSE